MLSLLLAYIGEEPLVLLKRTKRTTNFFWSQYKRRTTTFLETWIFNKKQIKGEIFSALSLKVVLNFEVYNWVHFVNLVILSFFCCCCLLVGHNFLLDPFIRIRYFLGFCHDKTWWYVQGFENLDNPFVAIGWILGFWWCCHYRTCNFQARWDFFHLP